MRELPSSEAKALVPQILNKTVRVPEFDRQEVAKAIADLKELRKTMPSLTLDEILSARGEGHKS